MASSVDPAASNLQNISDGDDDEYDLSVLEDIDELLERSPARPTDNYRAPRQQEGGENDMIDIEDDENDADESTMNETSVMDESLTVDGLKSHLLKQYREMGVVAKLKAQLRSDFVKRLGIRPTRVNDRNTATTAWNAEDEPIQKAAATPLAQRALNAAIAEYLQKNGYAYTYSVFLPDSLTPSSSTSGNNNGTENLSSAERLSSKDIQQILGFNAVLTESNNVAGRGTQQHAEQSTKMSNSPPAFMQNCLLGQLCQSTLACAQNGTSLRPQSPNVSRDKTSTKSDSNVLTLLGTGRKDAAGSASSLEQRLARVHETFLHRSGNEVEKRNVQKDSLEARMLAYQRQCDERLNRAIAREKERLKKNEVAKLELKYASKLREEVEKHRDELQTQYTNRFKALEESKDVWQSERQSERTRMELEAFETRQRLLVEMERIREKETSSRRAIEIEKRALDHERAHAEKLLRDLQTRETALASDRLDRQKDMERQITAWKDQYRADLSTRERRLRDAEKQLEDTKRDFETRYGEIQSKAREVDRMRDEMKANSEKMAQNEAETRAAKSELLALQKQFSIISKAAETNATELTRVMDVNANKTQRETELNETLAERERTWRERLTTTEQSLKEAHVALAELQASKLTAERLHAAELEALKLEPGNAVAQAEEAWRRTEQDLRRERLSLLSRLEEAEYQARSARTRCLEAEQMERGLRMELMELRSLLSKERTKGLRRGLNLDGYENNELDLENNINENLNLINIIGQTRSTVETKVHKTQLKEVTGTEVTLEGEDVITKEEGGEEDGNTEKSGKEMTKVVGDDPAKNEVGSSIPKLSSSSGLPQLAPSQVERRLSKQRLDQMEDSLQERKAKSNALESEIEKMREQASNFMSTQGIDRNHLPVPKLSSVLTTKTTTMDGDSTTLKGSTSVSGPSENQRAYERSLALEKALLEAEEERAKEKEKEILELQKSQEKKTNVSSSLGKKKISLGSLTAAHGLNVVTANSPLASSVANIARISVDSSATNTQLSQEWINPGQAENQAAGTEGTGETQTQTGITPTPEPSKSKESVVPANESPVVTSSSKSKTNADTKNVSTNATSASTTITTKKSPEKTSTSTAKGSSSTSTTKGPSTNNSEKAKKKSPKKTPTTKTTESVKSYSALLEEKRKELQERRARQRQERLAQSTAARKGKSTADASSEKSTNKTTNKTKVDPRILAARQNVIKQTGHISSTGTTRTTTTATGSSNRIGATSGTTNLDVLGEDDSTASDVDSEDFDLGSDLDDEDDNLLEASI
eukprot:g2386.t1